MPMPSRFPSQYAGSFGGDGCGSAMAPADLTAGLCTLDKSVNPTQATVSVIEFGASEGQPTWGQPPFNVAAQGATSGFPDQNPGNQINQGGGGTYSASPQGTPQGGGGGQSPLPIGAPSSASGPT